MIRDQPTLPRSADEVIFEARNLSHYFDIPRPWLTRVLDRQPRLLIKAVDGISFNILRGETLSLVGESGCGKSTVARVAVGLHAPTQGTIIFDGIDLAKLRSRAESATVRQRFQMIFQDPYASLNPRWRVRSIIAEPIRAHRLIAGSFAIRRRVDGLLRQVGLAPADGDKYPHEFSGGQRQRISIARALSSNPDFVVCDEPTSALDVSIQAQILNLMKDLQQEYGLTYLFISHNLAVVRHVSERVGVMYLGRLAEIGATQEIFANPRHPYTRMLLDAVPTLEVDSDGRARPIAGEVPNPLEPPTGCTFHPRCPLVHDRCRRERPELLPTATGTLVACHAVTDSQAEIL